ncbi:MAG: T9SS type A sorting domain-containing protein, partial [Bacteroidetes bacterium]|nr:T9SS type A sorting domain-containing protein [Bacteroidota bacterium]
VKNKTSTDTLTIPFFDDFADIQVYPDANLWSDCYAFINSEYPVDPPTIGVATLDALNQYGMIYSNANSTGFCADTLTSLPVFLEGYFIANPGFPSDSLYIYFDRYMYFSDSLLWAGDTMNYSATDSVIMITGSTLLFYISSGGDTLEFDGFLYYFDTLSQQYILLQDADSCRSDSIYIRQTGYDYFSDQLYWWNDSVYENAALSVISVNNLTSLFNVTSPGDTALYSGDLYYHNPVDPYYTLITADSVLIRYGAADSVFLSFYYQPQGIGFAPEASDSLVLQFRTSGGQWRSVWKAEGSEVQDFRLVMLHISDTVFLHDAFRFRYLNYASLSETSIPSFAGNNDVWHLDCIYLNGNRGYLDTLINDVAITTPLTSTLQNYEAMPWPHFRYDQSEAMNIFSTHSTNYTNLTFHTDRFYDLINEEAGIANLLRPLGANDREPFDTDTIGGYPISSLFNTDIISDSAQFEIKVYMKIDDTIELFKGPKLWNDTVRYRQTFFSYYAYDDGVAEAGYGLAGGGSENGYVAYRFHNYKADTLRAIEMFFNRTRNNANKKYFNLIVWDDNNGQPGNIIYRQDGMQVKYGYTLNIFARYLLEVPDTTTPSQFIIQAGNEKVLYLGTGDFYIGWQKIYTEDMLNVGFDKNNIHNDRLFYSYSGDWYPSQVQGSLMMRPVFGREVSVGIKENHIHPDEIILFPNPVSGTLNIVFPQNRDTEAYTMTVLDITGKQVYHASSTAGSIETGSFENGIYILRITDSRNIPVTKKFIVNH